MPSSQLVETSVKKLCEGYGRKYSDTTMEAYYEATRDLSDTELEIATTRLLRTGDQFMPSAPNLRRAALEAREERQRDRLRQDEQRGVKCLLCDDRGYLLTINRHWLWEHRSEIAASYLVAGWMREAHLWCVHNRKQDLLPHLICTCDAHFASVYRRQIERWFRRDPADKKIPEPAFWNQYNEQKDCRIPVPLPTDGKDKYIPEILIAWRDADRETTTWDGNWQP